MEKLPVPDVRTAQVSCPDIYIYIYIIMIKLGYFFMSCVKRDFLYGVWLKKEVHFFGIELGGSNNNILKKRDK